MKADFLELFARNILECEMAKKIRARTDHPSESTRSTLSLIAKLIVGNVHKKGIAFHVARDQAVSNRTKTRALLVRVVGERRGAYQRAWKRRPFRSRAGRVCAGGIKP
jgi:hypothetical protein